MGRDEELGRVLALLEGARGGMAGALVVEGEAGIGKTTILAAAQQRADGFTCLWAQGVESEAALGHAALLELLTPVRHRLAALPAAQVEALSAALGWGSAGVPGSVPAATPGDRYLVAAATLSILAAAAEQAPLLVLVDDLQWVDRESAAALLFAARRLRHDAVAFVFAVRTGATPPAPLDGLDVLTLTGLSAALAADLFSDRLADDVLARLVEATRGNPLALSEVGWQLTPAQRVGAAPLPDPLPVGARLELAYEPLLARLSAPAWQAVLLCAASTGGTAAPVTALRQDGLDAEAAIEEAEGRGVLVRDVGGLRFRHPLLRTAAWTMAAPAQQRAAHRSLAGALPGDAARALRTWHLCEAAIGADDTLADELVAVAEVDRTRRGFAAASAALERAALLTTDPGRASERAAAAVGDAFLAGDVQRTRALAERVLAGPAGRSARAQVLFTLGVLEQYAGSVPRAADLLAAAVEVSDGSQRVWALAELGLTRFRLNDLAAVGESADRIARTADVGDPGQRVIADFMRGFGLTLGGEPAAGRPLLAGVVELVQSPALRDDPRYLVFLALAAGFLGDVRDAVRFGERRLGAVRERGALGVLVPLLAVMASGRAQLGDHRGAFADAGEAAELGEQLGYTADTAVAVEMLAWQSAARGLHDDARRCLARARALTDRAGTTSVHAHQGITAAFCALSRGDLVEAASLLEARIDADGGVGSLGEPLGVAPTLVEAYVGLGRVADAFVLAERYAVVTPPHAPALAAALVARCRALAAIDDDVAVTFFEVALAAHADAHDPDVFEAARTRLLYGSRLRRAGRRVAAREQLRPAVEAFAAMDLTAWAGRAADELAATGATARPRGPLVAEPLTSQETRVALLVARGLSNRDVAAALFLSPKTIEHHLASVFRKRGYRSRTELARALLTAGEEDSLGPRTRAP